MIISTNGMQGNPCFSADCPMCSERTTFHLLVAPIDPSPEDQIVGIICEKCGYEVLVTEQEERDRLAQVSGIWQEYEAGAIDADTTAMRQAEVGSKVVARVVEESKSWICPKCSEKNPLNFIECWNCHYERTIEEGEDVPQCDPFPQFPEA